MGMDVDEPRRDHVAGGIDGFLAADLVLCDDGDPCRPLMPTLATASYFVSGSMTRPLLMTRSYSRGNR
jgi:hypothetical protein